jgi:predicted O-methyltransferase YrrM
MTSEGLDIIPLTPELYRPVISDAAVEFFDSLLQPHFRVFEWGAGGSTIWLAKTVEWVVTVEHHLEWLIEVARCAKEEGLDNIQYILCNWDTDYLYKDAMRELYARSILQFPDESFDLIFSDSWVLARSLCAQYAIDKLKPGGWFVADDFEWHPVNNKQSAGMLVDLGWEVAKRGGMCMGQWNHLHHPTITAFFRKPGGTR